MVRVQGKEYGPVETEVLREWRSEGPLIPANEVRRVGDERWIQAGELPEVFSDIEPSLPPIPAPALEYVRARSWREITTETLRTYLRGFVRFMFFGIFTSVPMFILQWIFPKIPLPDLKSGVTGALQVPRLPPLCLVMLAIVILIW